MCLNNIITINCHTQEVINANVSVILMNAMSATDELRSWFWIIPYWVISYSIVMIVSITVGSIIAHGLYWVAYLIMVPILIIPIVYKNLVGGGCSLRFQICAFVKGAFVGMLFFIVSMLVDPFVWNLLQPSLGWNALSIEGFTALIYQIWFYSGFFGGLGARIVEVRGYEQTSTITVAGFEDR